MWSRNAGGQGHKDRCLVLASQHLLCAQKCPELAALQTLVLFIFLLGLADGKF